MSGDGQVLSGAAGGVVPVADPSSAEISARYRDVSLGERVRRGLRGLFGGFAVTLRCFVTPSRVVTQQYPENRESLKMFERFRGRVVMPHKEEANTHHCTGCGICESACPNGTITILTSKDPETKKKKLDKFIYRFETCIICNLCIEECPFDAIAMSRDFETAVFDRRELVQILNKPGSKLE